MPKKPDPTKQKTRPDLDDEHWLVWLSRQPENKGIDTFGLYRSMLEWTAKKRITPTRLRLLNWLDRERQAVPMTMNPIPGTAGDPPATPASKASPSFKCERCFDTGEISTEVLADRRLFTHQMEFVPCPACRPQ